MASAGFACAQRNHLHIRMVMVYSILRFVSLSVSGHACAGTPHMEV